jgi:hypothetical protein
VRLAASVSPRGWDEGYEEASGRTAGAPSTFAVCRMGCKQGETSRSFQGPVA